MVLTCLTWLLLWVSPGADPETGIQLPVVNLGGVPGNMGSIPGNTGSRWGSEVDKGFVIQQLPSWAASA